MPHRRPKPSAHGLTVYRAPLAEGKVVRYLRASTDKLGQRGFRDTAAELNKRVIPTICASSASMADE